MASEKSGAAGTETYLYDNSWQRAREHLDMLGEFLDSGTIRHLERLGVDEGWHGWEVGGGGGSIAAWLGRRGGGGGGGAAHGHCTRFLAGVNGPNLGSRQT